MVSALRDVKKAVPGAELIEVTPDFVGLTDVAELIGVSRQNMRKLMLAHAATFPRRCTRAALRSGTSHTCSNGSWTEATTPSRSRYSMSPVSPCKLISRRKRAGPGRARAERGAAHSSRRCVATAGRMQDDEKAASADERMTRLAERSGRYKKS